MMATLSLRGTEWTPDICIKENYKEHDYWSERIDEAAYETVKGCIWSAVAMTLEKITNLSFFQVIYIASVSYSVTQSIRPLIADSAVLKAAEMFALRLCRSIPYLKVLIVLVASLFFQTLPLVSVFMAMGLGILQGLTHTVQVLGNS